MNVDRRRKMRETLYPTTYTWLMVWSHQWLVSSKQFMYLVKGLWAVSSYQSPASLHALEANSAVRKNNPISFESIQRIACETYFPGDSLDGRNLDNERKRFGWPSPDRCTSIRQTPGDNFPPLRRMKNGTAVFSMEPAGSKTTHPLSGKIDSRPSFAGISRPRCKWPPRNACNFRISPISWGKIREKLLVTLRDCGCLKGNPVWPKWHFFLSQATSSHLGSCC